METAVKSKLAAAALALLTVTAGAVASSRDAQAGHRTGHAIGLGIATGLLVGAAIASAHAGPRYYRCGWVRQYDAWGRYIGKARVCH
jgi:hypothetical protein